MQITISFGRELTLAAISGIEEYYEAAESGLRAIESKELAQIRDMAAAQNWEYDDWAVAKQEHEMTFDMLVPNYFRYSCIVLLYLVLESKLKEMCEIAHEATPGEPLPDFGQDFVRRCKRYLKDAAGFSSKHWEHIENLSKIRNCVVHTSGKVEGKHCKQIEQLARVGIGIAVSGNERNMPTELLPLYLEDNMLMIEPQYCRWIIKAVHEFFEEVCDALSLPPLSLEK